MLNEFDLVGRVDEKISSGETSILLQMQEDWHRLYHMEEYGEECEDLSEDELYDMCKARRLNVKKGEVKLHYRNVLKSDSRYKRWTIEEVEEDPIPFLNEVKRLKVVPAYLYVLNYIFFRVNLAVGRRNQRKFAAYIQAGVFPDAIDEDIDKQCSELLYHKAGDEEREFEQKDFDIIYQQLIKRLSFEFMKNGNTGKTGWPDFFKEIIEGFNFKLLKELALGLHMPLDDFEIFLRKVLKRSGINFYDRDEVFVYLVLKYADKRGCGRYIEAYHNLWELYGDVGEEKDKDGGENTESVSTVYIQKKLDGLETTIDRNPFKEKSPALQSYISQIAYQNGRLESGEALRTAKKRFYNIWEDMKKRWEGTEQMQEIIAANREKNKKSSVIPGTPNNKKLTIRYCPSAGVFIPKNTQFSADTMLKKKNNGIDKKAVFETCQDIRLEPIADDKIEVKVKALLPLQEYKEYCKRKDIPGTMKKSPDFVKTDNLKKEKVVSRMIVDSPELKTAIHNISIGSKVRFADSDSKTNEGTLIVECVVGTFIPAGTRFHFKIGEMVFPYESIAPANVHEYELEVRPLQSWAETGLDNQEFRKTMEASLGKGKSLKKGATIKKYSKFESDSDVISAFSGKSGGIGYFNDGQEKHMITVICKKNCEIPKGTIFRYRTEFYEFLYETVNDFNIHPYAEVEIDTRWTNKNLFQDYVNKNAVRRKNKKGEETDQYNEIEILPSNLKFDCRTENVYSVTAKKRTALQPEMRKDKKDYEVSDSALLRFIYSSTKNAVGIGYYEGVPSYGKDFLLNTQLFKDTKLLQGTFSVLTSNEERLRNYILTLKFLEFVWWQADDIEDDFGERGLDIFGDDWYSKPGLCENIADYNLLIDDFQYEADKELMRCGFQPFFPTGFPYDAFLALLLTGEDPLALFQKIWSDDGLSGKEKKDEKAAN